MTRPWFSPKARTRILSLVVIVGISGLITFRHISTQSPLHALPPVDFTHAPSHVQDLGHPTFAEIRALERALPQHIFPTFLTKARPRYLRFSWESWGTGWNNVFQEQLLNTHLACLSNRGYVFVDYIARDHPPFPDTLPNGTRHMLHIPMNAFTSGPTGGGPLSANGESVKSAPRAVSKEWWEAICREQEVVEVNVGETNQALGLNGESSGEERLSKWADKLLQLEATCVEIVGGSVFDYLFISSDKVLSMWTSYGSSPTLKAFAWSALITRALERNFGLISSLPPPQALSRHSWPFIPGFLPSLPFGQSNNSTGDVSSPYPLSSFSPYHTSEPPIPGLLGLHVRRGDYEQHCVSLADWGAGYNAWNAFGRPDVRSTARYPPLPDFLAAPGRAAVLPHCWPATAQIVERVRAVRAESESGMRFPAQELSAVYISTNGEPGWVAALAEMLRADGWETVSTSLDMRLTKEELAVAQAVDMGVLVSAETFIGVGFSSLSSNVAQLRLAGGRHPDTIRFW
ncbi:hypothetical protein B0H10DRAFT_808539 [Mycena sp. CBHHK59/15]|nr:hypothetical protein B0H10DRAFT_808539 [Mycena sp. CBHHK59/15]